MHNERIQDHSVYTSVFQMRRVLKQPNPSAYAMSSWDTAFPETCTRRNEMQTWRSPRDAHMPLMIV